MCTILVKYVQVKEFKPCYGEWPTINVIQSKNKEKEIQLQIWIGDLLVKWLAHNQHPLIRFIQVKSIDKTLKSFTLELHT
jgi:hypothetical protein